MKKSILQLSAIILAAFSIAAFAGCDKDSSSDSNNSVPAISEAEKNEEKTLDPALVGTWQTVIYHTRYTDTYSADGTLKIMEEDMDSPVGGEHYATSISEYKAYTEGDKLYHISKNSSSRGEFTYSVSGNTLNVTTSTGAHHTYTKQ